MQFAEKKTQGFWMILLYLSLIGIAIWFLGSVGSIIGNFAIAGAIAYILNPAVEFLAGKRVPRGVATLLIFTVFAGIVALLIIAVIPPAVRQFEDLLKNLPTYFETLQNFWVRVTKIAHSSSMPPNVQALPDELAENLQKVAGKAGGAIFGGITKFLGTITGLVIVPILVYYFLSDGPSIHKSLIAAVPPPWRKDSEALLERMNKALGGFIRGQLKLCLAMGVTTFLVYVWLFPKYSVIFGLIAGVTEFIPYAGPIIALIGPLIVAAFYSPGKVLFVLIAFVVLQILEGNILAPKIIGKDVDLHPALIIFVMMCGGSLAGLVGMIAAIPAAVIIKVLYQYFYVERYLNSFSTIENHKTDTAHHLPEQSGAISDDMIV